MCAYAGTMRMIQDRIMIAHDNDQETDLFGFSFGANAISAYLAYIDTLPTDERTKSLPRKVFVIEGGKIFESIKQLTYGREVDPNIIAAVETNLGILPRQAPLPPDIAKRTFAVINPGDLSVLGQEEIWDGASMYTIIGRHATAPIKRLSQIRKLLRTHFGTLAVRKFKQE